MDEKRCRFLASSLSLCRRESHSASFDGKGIEKPVETPDWKYMELYDKADMRDPRNVKSGSPVPAILA